MGNVSYVLQLTALRLFSSIASSHVRQARVPSAFLCLYKSTRLSCSLTNTCNLFTQRRFRIIHLSLLTCYYRSSTRNVFQCNIRWQGHEYLRPSRHWSLDGREEQSHVRPKHGQDTLWKASMQHQQRIALQQPPEWSRGMSFGEGTRESNYHGPVPEVY
jgi:hypothetical protein